MRSASFQALSTLRRRRPNSRQIALLIVVAVHLLLIGALIRQVRSQTPAQPASAAMELLPTFEPPAPEAADPAAVDPGPQPPSLQPVPVPRRPPPPVPPTLNIPDIDFDLAEVPPQEAAAPPAVETAQAGATGKASGPVYGPVLEARRGGRPPGETLYNAEWHIEPTNAQLSYYLPSGGVPDGSWGMVECRTIDAYRVEDCAELEESPPGSGVAGVVRKAAWQFRVRPPRSGGRLLVGAWVRIRIEFNRDEINLR